MGAAAQTKWLWLLHAALLAGGCGQPGPDYLPVAPLQTVGLAAGGSLRTYDTTGDGRGDYVQQLDSQGRVVKLSFDFDDDGRPDLSVDRTAPADAGRESRQARKRTHLLIIADSVPFSMIHQLYAQGRFRLFYPPCRVISPFPVMTDPCLNELFGVSPGTAVETESFDGRRLRDGWGPYRQESNSPWLAAIDCRLPFASHGDVYLDPHRWTDRELLHIQRAVQHATGQDVAAYVVSTSALGIQFGRNGHLEGLVRLDRLCGAIMHAMRGEIEITLMSDHGHDLVPSHRADLRGSLSRMGYRVTDRLEKPGDVILPAFGLVTYASVYSRNPGVVAGDLIGTEGVDLTFYRDEGGEVIALCRDGMAKITRAGTKYRYEAVYGDPLQLRPIIADLQRKGQVDSNGFADDRALFDATIEHVYPDPLHRLHRAFHGLVRRTPDVLVSLERGWYWGSGFMSRFLAVAAGHGDIRRESSTGFVMTTVGALPPSLRMREVADELRRLGVHLPRPTAARETAARSSTNRSE